MNTVSVALPDRFINVHYRSLPSLSCSERFSETPEAEDQAGEGQEVEEQQVVE
jgi:hypothetical protein